MRVVITGAAGRIGSEMVQELSNSHELCLIDRVPVPGKTSIVADLTTNHACTSRRVWPGFRCRIWMDLFQGVDVVLHLAGDVRNDAPWESVLRDNIQVTWNVIEIAARYQVPRVIFASSNWAVRALEQALAPECYQPAGPKIASDAPPRPLCPYGISKALGELTGRMFVDQRRLRSFVAVRIGAYALEAHKTDERLRAIWIGVRDLRSLIRRCVELPSEGFHVVYGVSGQPSAPYDLSYTRDFLSWQPRQNSMNGC
jgi:NAD+ dependent glucose-6-phosphate dehydrogenase